MEPIETKKVLETATWQDDLNRQANKATAISSTSGAKLLKNLEALASFYEQRANRSKTFLGDLSNQLDLIKVGNSHYGTFETWNDNIITIRISNHNATVSNFDQRNEKEGISIVVTNKPNKGITNDGKAHVVEYFYRNTDIIHADTKPLVDIIRSVQQALYSGEFTDKSGLSKRQEVNQENSILKAKKKTKKPGLKF